MLPLGLRVQENIERLLDKHMRSLGASKVSLSSLSSEELWQRSGRLEGRDSEFFRLKDRKDGTYLLAPTHEEEITSVVADSVHSYKDLPLRLYQISRKYRDEARPRQGLLRGREFLMKDLYTFDASEQEARETYEQVRAAYRAFFDDLRLPYLVAKADSGNMGGSLSHEYHFVSNQGEDNIISCNKCDYSMNEEIDVRKYHPASTESSPKIEVRRWMGISKDRGTLVVVYYPAHNTAAWERSGPGDSHTVNEVSTRAIKAAFPLLDSSVEHPFETWMKTNPPNMTFGTESPRCIHLMDPRIAHDRFAELTGSDRILLQMLGVRNTVRSVTAASVLLTSAARGEMCPQCNEGTLSVEQAVEVGHTFHLSTRYSKPLEATVVNGANEKVFMEMGCHGIGVSRLIGAVAAILSDDRGLNWPLAIAPFQLVLIADKKYESDAIEVYTSLRTSRWAEGAAATFSVVLDDRDKGLIWRLNEADLVGYPFAVVLGKSWTERRMVEIQCRRLGIKEEVQLDRLVERIQELGRQF